MVKTVGVERKVKLREEFRKALEDGRLREFTALKVLNR
jgi:hypothetical protein